MSHMVGPLIFRFQSFSQQKKAIINLKNEDDECFKWAITRALNPVEQNSERIDRKLRETSKPSIERDCNFQSIWVISINLKIRGLELGGSKIPSQFENHNSSISVNVFGQENLVYPIRISKHNYKRESTVNLLLISDDTKQHYCWFKDISKLLSLQTEKHGHVRHVCFRCLHTFNSDK